MCYDTSNFYKGEAKMKAVYYTDNTTKKSFNLENEFKKWGYSLDSTSDYAKVICEARQSEIDLLILDGEDYFVNQKTMDIFSRGSAFCVPQVVLGCSFIRKEFKLPLNYRQVEYDKICEEINYILGREAYQMLSFTDIKKVEYSRLVNSVLMNLGFNISTHGTEFLKESVVAIMEQGCMPCPLTKTVYLDICNRHNSTLANVMRCSRASLESAYRKNKKNAKVLESGICFDDFTLCPSVKEFVYYVATKLTEYLEKKK